MRKTPAAPTNTTVAIYARISDSRDGNTEGVDRQVVMCRAHAETHGMTVAGVYVDNNRSAYKPKGKRPQYDRILADLEAGLFEAVLVVATDRLYRQMKDLEALVARLGGDRQGKPVYTIRSGDVDLATADGRLNARLLGAVAMHSSEKASERIKDAAIDRAQRGRFNGGMRRFGYSADLTELIEDEAEALRWAYEYVADGGTIRGAARELERRGLAGANGGQMTPAHLTAMLRRPVNGGLASFNGEILEGVASLAPAIVDEELWRRVNLIIRDPSRFRTRGRHAKALLAGILKCGKCGASMYTQADNRRQDVIRLSYRCTKGGCLRRSTGPLDAQVVGGIAAWLDEHKSSVVKPRKFAKGDESLPAQANSLRRELEEIQLWHAAGEITVSEWKKVRDVTRAKLDVVLARIEALSPTSTPAVSALLRDSDPAQLFVDADMESKRIVIKELVRGIVLPYAGRGQYRRGDVVNLQYLFKDGVVQT
jgi:site-specific DNA recombinase